MFSSALSWHQPCSKFCTAMWEYITTHNVSRRIVTVKKHIASCTQVVTRTFHFVSTYQQFMLSLESHEIWLGAWDRTANVTSSWWTCRTAQSYPARDGFCLKMGQRVTGPWSERDCKSHEVSGDWRPRRFFFLTLGLIKPSLTKQSNLKLGSGPNLSYPSVWQHKATHKVTNLSSSSSVQLNTATHGSRPLDMWECTLDAWRTGGLNLTDGHSYRGRDRVDHRFKENFHLNRCIRDAFSKSWKSIKSLDVIEVPLNRHCFQLGERERER